MNKKGLTEESTNLNLPFRGAGGVGRRGILFIDRDGTLIKEAPPTYQLDSFPKLEFYPHMFEYMTKIVKELDYELVMVTNQDGLGTDVFPEDTFWPVHNFIMKSLENESIYFDRVCIDRTFPSDHSDTRKPGTGMLKDYLNDEKYDIKNSFVIGDRITDVMLAKNLGCKALWLNNHNDLGSGEVNESKEELKQTIALETMRWKDIYDYLKIPPRKATLERNTNETSIRIEINLDGTGESKIDTGIGFFDHMVHQVAKHGGIDLNLECKGDLQVDEHHTIEDTGIALGEVIAKALGDKRGIERYGFVLPMDDALAQVALDFGGRNWLVWEVEFKREKIGEMPTEMFFHFFKSFSDAARCNINIKAEGDNEHHKIESVFKAFAKALKMAMKRDIENNSLPTTKGVL